MSLIITRNFKRAKAQDAAELRVVHAKGIGKWWVEPNLSRFNDADRERIQKGRKEFPDREAAMKYARGTGKTFIVNDACDARDAAPFKVGDLVRMSEGGLTGKITKIEPNGHFRVSFLYNKANGFSQSFSANEIVMVKPAADAAEFHVGQRVRAKDPAYEYSDGKSLGAGMFTVKEVNSNGDVKLDDYGDVWISPSALVEANDACGKGEDAKNDFANRIMPLVRKIADAQKVVESVIGEAEELGYEAAHGEFPDSTFAKRSANQLEEACYEAVTALRKVKTIAVL